MGLLAVLIGIGDVLTFFYCLINSCATFQELGYSVGQDTAVGVPAWANDGSGDVVGILELSQEAIIFPPLQGFLGRGNFRYMVQLQENLDGGSSIPTSLFNNLYRNEFALRVYYMKTANYVAIETLQQPEGLRSVRVIGVDGREWGQFTDIDLGNPEARFFVLPSRDGALIAVVSWINDFDNFANGLIPAAFLITFLSTANESLEPALATPITFNTTLAMQTPYFSWATDGSDVLTITDFNSSAVEVNGSGSVTELATVEPCTNTFPPTSSGLYRSTDNAFVILAGVDFYGIDLSPTLPDFVCTN